MPENSKFFLFFGLMKGALSAKKKGLLLTCLLGIKVFCCLKNMCQSQLLNISHIDFSRSLISEDDL